MGNPELVFKCNYELSIKDVEEFKKDLINDFELQLNNQRTQSAIANRVATKAKHDAKAETYEYVIQMIKSIKVR